MGLHDVPARRSFLTSKAFKRPSSAVDCYGGWTEVSEDGQFCGLM